jgi:hypothetical protein
MTTRITTWTMLTRMPRPEMRPWLALCLLLAAPAVHAEVEQLTLGAFAVTHEVVLPGAPEAIYDALTGDISGWWDHTMSDSPKRLRIDPHPGGFFEEIFDDAGNGARHAVVIYADRGKRLRFDGPLGLSGHAVQFVTTYDLSPAGSDSTRLIVSCHVAGEIEEGLPEIVDGVWHHFIFERFKPYVESGGHLQE